MNNYNVLILSCGTRNKLVQYFKQELGNKGLVIAADADQLAPALNEADKYYIIPRIEDKNYLDVVLSICEDNQVKAVISLIDPELSLLSKHQKEFKNIGTIPIISEEEIVEMCFDKYKMHKFLLKNKLPSVKSYLEIQDFYKDLENQLIQYPVFVKPVKGSASININKVYSNEELEYLFSRYEDLMIQEFMNGNEYGVDVYIDMLSGEPVTVFIKRKIKMRAGETDKAISVKDEKLLQLILEFVKKAGFKGVIDIDIFEVNGNYYISEVNPRFGGGYSHAHELGINIPRMIINNIMGDINNDLLDYYDEGIYMMKYNDIIISDKLY